MALVIGRVEAHEIRALSEVVAKAWYAAYPFLPPEVLEEYATVASREQALLRAFNAGWDVYVARDGDLLLGTVSEFRSSRREGYATELDGFYVAPEAKGRGVGKALFNALVRGFVARGAGSMALHTLERNAAGRRFYEERGGELIGTGDWKGFPVVWYGWTLAGAPSATL